MLAGVILCGGKSSRMGYPKAWLPFGEETMLARVARILSEVTPTIVVVAAPDQELPPIGREAIVVRDAREGRGPLEGLLAGLSALPEDCEAAYVTSCDVPLLKAEFVRAMFAALDPSYFATPVSRPPSPVPYSAAVPVEERFAHPLATVYRPSVLPVIAELIAADQMRPAYLFDRVPTNRVPVESLRAVDPELQSLANLNRPDDYLAALKTAGYTCPAEIIAGLGLPSP